MTRRKTRVRNDTRQSSAEMRFSKLTVLRANKKAKRVRVSSRWPRGELARQGRAKAKRRRLAGCTVALALARHCVSINNSF